MADDDEQMDDEQTDHEMTMEEAMAAEAATAPAGGAAPELDEVSGEDPGGDAVLQPGDEDEESQRAATDLAAVYNVPVKVSAVLGRASMQVSSLLKMGQGAVIELDRKVGEAIDIYVNNRLVARGEVVVVDERLGVTMTEIIKGDKT
jgi:flagellar motor switch protein FliN/FliY